MDNRPIGVFDSGVGGLTVVKQIIKILPNEELVYFGDTARVPYGSKSKETVTKFSEQIIRFLKTKNVKAIVIACNTVSSNCYESLSEAFKGLPIIEVVTPGVESCLAATKNKRVALIGTQGTVSSGAYERRLKNADNEIQVFKKACPLFVPLAEEGWTDNEIARLTVKEYISELVEKGIDSIILGCTHYPLFKATIGDFVGEKVAIVDPAKATALKLKEFLENHNMLNESSDEGKRRFYVSDNYANFDKMCESVLHYTCKAEKVDIEKY
ncbi:MAG: glutamate racemase [Clostridia bacterium]|nr:glutamate racemase [Clostridia bacterium]